MLNFILSFFLTSSPKPVPTVTPSPKWTAYKKHLARAHAQAQKEQRVGFINAMLELVDAKMGTPAPEQFNCPDCQAPNTLEPTENLQRCICGAFHKTEVLLADGWTL